MSDQVDLVAALLLELTYRSSSDVESATIIMQTATVTVLPPPMSVKADDSQANRSERLFQAIESEK